MKVDTEFCVIEKAGLIIRISFSDVKYTNGRVSEQCYESLKAYTLGNTQEVNCPIDIVGTPFQQAVLNVVKAIPYGQTMTYKEVAIKAGYDNAFRAVGMVMKNNRYVIKIPCHRVVAKNHLGGFNGGLKLKERLLQLEQSKSLTFKESF